MFKAAGIGSKYLSSSKSYYNAKVWCSWLEIAAIRQSIEPESQITNIGNEMTQLNF